MKSEVLNQTKIKPGQVYRIADSAISIDDVFPDNQCVVGVTDSKLPIAASFRSLGSQLKVGEFWYMTRRKKDKARSSK